MTNEELVVRIKASIDTAENMLVLWQQCYRFIHSMAKRYQDRAELEDLEQEGYLALYDAVDGYNSKYGCRFLTYAGKWIKLRMTRYIQNNGTVRIPVHVCVKLQEYRKVVNVYSVCLGRTPTRHEIAVSMGISDKIAMSLEKAVQMGKIRSLDSYLTDAEDGGTMGDMIPGDIDVEGDVLEDVQQGQLKAVIWSYVDELPEQQRYVLRQRFQYGKTLKATGEGIGETVHRVKTIEGDALRNMRYGDSSNILRSFLTDFDEEIYSMGIKETGNERFATTWTSSTERVAIAKIGQITAINSGTSNVTSKN